MHDLRIMIGADELLGLRALAELDGSDGTGSPPPEAVDVDRVARDPGHHPGNTLWDWLQLLSLPIVFPTVLLPAFLRWTSGSAAQRAKEAAARRAEARAETRPPSGPAPTPAAPQAQQAKA